MRIRVQAFAVNPTDTGVRAGQRDSSQASPPYVPGMDAAGVIDEVGPDVTGWDVGDEIKAIALPLSTHGGAYVQEFVAPVGSFTRIPRRTSVEAASTVPMNGLTALQILSRAALAPRQTLAVTGAARLLGNYVVQLARTANVTVIADAAPADEAVVRALGPDHIVPRGAGFADAVRSIPRGGVDALADASVQQAEVVDAVKDGGVFFSVRGCEGNGARDIRFDKIMVSEEYRSFDKLEQLRHAVEGGTVTPRVAEVLPASRAAEAHERLEAGGTRGRFVLSW
ncbi:NADP-dependent oxidoreductase [Curtobacterium sp. VKM Ac-1395]|uniref:NADP-dependent oxidoreductase n=1 Tax=Curtobacterium sp. VKM Ac-1395 TaxID=2783815 RepID=UPI00188CCC44|nr:NADP-dependent oxidoreductase [Curtobacterium sp. VKM Ac-1395]MBF4591608.1 NADP-dependent oxidoreductase [Curtobacterium sp. VKM Ac-1395]